VSDADYTRTGHDVVWIDRGREPKCAPNASYPNGIDVDATFGAQVPSCIVALPYPARRCGIYEIRCNVCGVIIAATTAGRPDDPRSIKIPCKGMGQ